MNIETKFSAYNQAWEQGRIEKPLVVLIGGHIGTGKSTFAKMVEERLSYVTSLPTGIIRSIQQSNTSFEENPYLFLHSYDLGKVNPDQSKTLNENTLNGFQRQAEIVQRALLNIIKFSESEGQQYIIEGNHILPAFSSQQTNNNIISIFFKVEDCDLYSNMVSGPTHRRTLTPDQFSATRYIHDFITNQAKEYTLPLFEHHQKKHALQLIADHLETLLP